MIELNSSKAKLCLVLLTAFTISCSSVQTHSESANQVLTIAPYQRSAVTLVSPAGAKTKACTFEKFDGKLTMEKSQPSAMTFSVQTSSIATSDKKLNDVMKEKSFFDTAKFPVAEFQTTQIEKDNSPGALPTAFTVSGSLSFRGEKMNVKIPASIENSDKEVQMMFQFPVTSKDWLAKFSTAPDVFFKDQMDVVAKLVFPKPVKELPVEKQSESPKQMMKMEPKPSVEIKKTAPEMKPIPQDNTKSKGK